MPKDITQHLHQTSSWSDFQGKSLWPHCYLLNDVFVVDCEDQPRREENCDRCVSKTTSHRPPLHREQSFTLLNS